MDPELSAPARIVRSVALRMVVGVVASLAAIGFVDLVLLLNEWLLVSPRSRFMQDDRALLRAGPPSRHDNQACSNSAMSSGMGA